jgi:hypothetical protein
MKKSGDIGIGNSMLDRKPRLVSLRQERDEKRMRDELNGESQRQKLSKVTLPSIKWGNKFEEGEGQ